MTKIGNIVTDKNGYLVIEHYVHGSQAYIHDRDYEKIERRRREFEYQERIARLEEENRRLRREYDEVKQPPDITHTNFDCGWGLSLVKDRDPQFYQVNPNDGKSLIPSFFKDIDGIELEVMPGRGFRFRPHHRGEK